MVTKKFPSFNQGLAQDPTTRRIWYGIATAHDFESHDGMTEEKLYQKLFSTHFGHLAIIALWVAGNLFHIAWQGKKHCTAGRLFGKRGQIFWCRLGPLLSLEPTSAWGWESYPAFRPGWRRLDRSCVPTSGPSAKSFVTPSYFPCCS